MEMYCMHIFTHLNQLQPAVLIYISIYNRVLISPSFSIPLIYKHDQEDIK